MADKLDCGQSHRHATALAAHDCALVYIGRLKDSMRQQHDEGTRLWERIQKLEGRILDELVSR